MDRGVSYQGYMTAWRLYSQCHLDESMGSLDIALVPPGSNAWAHCVDYVDVLECSSGGGRLIISCHVHAFSSGEVLYANASLALRFSVRLCD